MGKGTIPTNQLPKKKMIYGNASFHLRPIHLADEVYFFALRPCHDEDDYDFVIEGEFAQGKASLDWEKTSLSMTHHM